jgi:hypothetical protein
MYVSKLPQVGQSPVENVPSATQLQVSYFLEHKGSVTGYIIVNGGSSQLALASQLAS